MNALLLAIILGIIEGLTEFIPVSSTGHLIIANYFFDFEGEFANLFAVVIQTGAILAAMIYFKDKVIPPVRNNEAMKSYVQRWGKVLIAVLPAIVLALLFEDIIDKYLFNPLVVSIALILGAVMLIITENKEHKSEIEDESQITYSQALKVGIFQCLSIILPGFSRSAATIIGGLTIGFSRKLSAEFSFLLAMPALIGASAYKLIKFDGIISGEQWKMLGLGTVVSFVVAYVVIAFFMNYIKKNDMKIFAYYRIVLGVIVLGLFYS